MKLGLIKNQELPTEVLLLDDNFTHSLCVGQTGGISLTHEILFFDIKGSEYLSIKSLSKQSNRIRWTLK